MSVVIVDYGMGNLFSVKRIFDRLGIVNCISDSPDDIASADKIVLPGVGSFKTAMENLNMRQLISPLNKAVIDDGKPFLGICLGMQLMAKMSSEGGETNGLGWINATVEHLPSHSNLRLPHVGWNSVTLDNNSPLFKSFIKQPTFYFTHNYVMSNVDRTSVVASCNYGETFAAAIQSKNMFGVQFHPEKSQLNGRILIENFMNCGV